MERFEDMRFGIFMHWGPSILRGTSSWGRGNHPYDFAPRVPIDEFDSLYLQFNPVLFDAADWISTVKEAGAGYYVITTKHHDGFCIWDSDYTDYDMMSTPYRVDVLKQLSEECEKQGILFGTYYSICDWHHPEYPGRYGGDPRPRESSDMDKYREYLYHQMDELVDKYSSKIMWFDGSWESDWTHEDGMDLYKYLRDKDNKIIINNRVDKKQNLKQRREHLEKFAGDYKTPEQEIGEYDIELPWESCITITDRGWHFNPRSSLKSLQELINILAQTAGGGGNLLLNIGPMPDGRLDMFHRKRLLELGAWLKKNGESIYGTEGGPFKPNEYSASTRKGNKIYLHILDWPADKISIPKIEKEVKRSYILNGADINIRIKNDYMEVEIPEEHRKSKNTILVFEIEGDVLEIEDMKPAEFRNIITAKLLNEPDEKYSGFGAKSLTNKSFGTSSNLYKDWLGYEEEDFSAVLDLSVSRNISKMVLGCLQNQDQWIFLPQRIEIHISADGQEYNKVGSKTIETVRAPIPSREVLEINFNADDARFVKIIAKNIGTCPEWHKGKGGKAWLFVDEIEIK
jgi:alpha-L-fucosidase